ncbi:MAG: transglycosylase SLT domain-containing protein [Gammaproteobacteria bacterium]|nr:transglycosylase SLT domain-containing protein [Gammaproteobacteria bacterium]MCY4219126.1 transglycosylase SLT domain-containing protein [Gammaproteobacteria bacterium]MCY4275809.1 transglycosylase SLT domain-containing protein [Gammaproteobacteria bacterium]
MIISTVLAGKLPIVSILVIGLSINASGAQNHQTSDDINAPEDTQKEQFVDSRITNREVVDTGVNQENLLDNRNLWEFLQKNFKLKYSNLDEKLIQSFEKRYSNPPEYFERVSKRAYWYLPFIVEEIKKRDLPVDLAIIPIIESGFRPTAVSTSKAVGLWQFIPSTGAKFGLRQDWWIDERKDFIKSTQAALDYLTFLLGEFDNDWELALASYNGGVGRVRNAINVNLRTDQPTTFSSLKLPRETRTYLPKFIAIRNIISNPKKYGINLYPIPKEATIAVVDAKSQIDLTLMASLISVKPRVLKDLNPEYLNGVTPPDGPHDIVVPFQLAATSLNTLAKKAPWVHLKWDIHRVQKGENLGAIAAQYNTHTRILKRLNNLKSDKIYPDQTLRIPIPRIDEEKFFFDSESKVTLESNNLENGDIQSKTSKSLVIRKNIKNSIFRVGDGIYYAKNNDNLEHIANLFRISVEQLRELNGIDPSSEIVHGQRLIIRKE